MIDYLTFIEELKGLKKKALNPETRNITLEFNKLIEKYEKRVSDFESEMAPKEEVTRDECNQNIVENDQLF